MSASAMGASRRGKSWKVVPPLPDCRTPKMTTFELSILLVAIALLIFCSGLFSSLETALFSLKRHQLRRLEGQHPALGPFTQMLREHPRRGLHILPLGDGPGRAVLR